MADAREVLDTDIQGSGLVLMKWSGAHLTALSDTPGHGYLELVTANGTVRCVPGDWIVKDGDSFRRLSAGEAVAAGLTA